MNSIEKVIITELNHPDKFNDFDIIKMIEVQYKDFRLRVGKMKTSAGTLHNWHTVIVLYNNETKISDHYTSFIEEELFLNKLLFDKVDDQKIINYINNLANRVLFSE